MSSQMYKQSGISAHYKVKLYVQPPLQPDQASTGKTHASHCHNVPSEEGQYF
jgi:hypothetical protein